MRDRERLSGKRTLDRERFVDLAMRNRFNAEIIARLPALELPDAWIVSGCLFQTVWNVMTDREPTYGINDYDVFYFDADRSKEREEVVAARIGEIFADLDVTIEARNQARVHEWYEADFGTAYPPLRCSTEGIDRFLVCGSMVGVRRTGTAWDVYAPHGFDDIAAMIVRPNRAPNFSATHYLAKARRWKAMWPEVTVLPP